MSDDGKENDSDIEIINPRELRLSYFQQQIRLLHDIRNLRLKIPKDLNLFKEFLNQNIKWHPSEELMCSVFKRLCVAENAARGKSASSSEPVIELSDDENDCTIMSVSSPPRSQAPRILSNHKSKIKKPVALIDPFIKESTPPLVDFMRNRMKDLKESIQLTSPKKGEKPLVGASSVKNETPTPATRTDSSLIDLTEDELVRRKSKKPRLGPAPPLRPAQTLSEEGAEALREQLLIDKIIELELPKILKSLGTVLPSYFGEVVAPPLKKSRTNKRTILKS